MKLPYQLENQMSNPYEYVHQVYPAIPVRSPVDNNENKPLSNNWYPKKLSRLWIWSP